jgi:hypothetical protein
MRFVFLIAPACLALAGCISNETASLDPAVTQTASIPSTFVEPAEVPFPTARPDFGDRNHAVAQAVRTIPAQAAIATAAPDSVTQVAQSTGNPAPEPLRPAPALSFAPNSRTLLAYQEVELAEEGPEDAEAPLDPQPALEGQRWRLAYSYVKADCFPAELKQAMNVIAERFKSEVMVISGYRGNGRRGSLHRSCRAADIRVAGVAPSVLAAFAKTVPGINGVGQYRRTTLVHIDVRATRFAWRY